MKNELEEYFSKSNFKNFNTFYKDYYISKRNKKLPLFSKSVKSNYYIQKKSESNVHLTSTPSNINVINNKIIRDKLFLNFKVKLKQKIKRLFKSPNNSRNSKRSLKLFFSPINSSSIETERIKSNCIINFVNDYESDFFPDSTYLNMEYNENEIFKDRTIYDKYVKQKLELLKNKKNFSKDIKVEKNFKYGKNKKEINLVLESIEISFKEMTDISNIQNNNLKLNLPLSLLPIFYYKGIDAFIKFLSLVLKVDKNFEKINFIEDKVYDALNNLKDYNNIIKELDDFDDIFKYDKNPKQNTKYLRIKKVIHLKPEILKKNKNFLKYNYFVFFWTTNLKTFICTIKLPCIHLNIIENKVEINHFIDYELLFYLIQNNFYNWEYYVIKYLSTYSKFRNIFQQIGSISNIYNKKIFLKESKRKINSFAEESLINIYTDQFNNNKIILFKSFYVIANIVDFNFHQEEIYFIHFNFFHYLKLYQIIKYCSKILFLIKFIELNQEFNTLNFNYEEFTKFNITSWINNIKKFSNKNLNYNNEDEELLGEFNIYSKTIKVEFKRPSWTLIKIENKNEIKKSWEIGKDLEKELIYSIIDSNAKTWTKLLNGCLQKVDEPIPILPEIFKKKTFNKILSKKNIHLSENDKRYNKRLSKIFK